MTIITSKKKNVRIRAMRESGFKQTSLSVQKDNPAVRFYQRLGYEMPEGNPGHAGQDDFLMVKDLMKDGK